MSIGISIKSTLKKNILLIITAFVDASIRKKLIAGYLIVTIIPLFAITAYYYTSFRTNLINQNYTNMENNLIQTNKNIDTLLNTFTKESDIVYLNTTLKSYLTANYNSANIEDAYYYFNNYFNNLLISSNGVTMVSVYSFNNTLASDDFYIKDFTSTVLTDRWYLDMKASTGGVMYSGATKEANGEYVFVLSRYLNYGNVDYSYGILRMNVAVSQLYSLIEKPGKDYTTYVIDSSGNIISCSDKSLITRSIYHTLGINSLMLSGNGRLTIDYKGQKMLVAYRYLENGWKTISIIPYNSFLSSVQKTASFVLIIFIISLIIASILIYTLSKILTKNINVMVRKISNLEPGNFDLTFENMGNDEIGKLSKAFNHMSQKLKVLIEDVYQKELQKKQAEMNVLQEQINPHFLYNALSSISSLALMNNDNKVTEMSSLLSKFYRLSLSKGSSIVPINDEIELTKYYVEIQKIRFNKLVNVVFDIDESSLKFKTLKLILQPFIENSINHAIWDDDRCLNIIVRLYSKQNSIVFEVLDDGTGMKPIIYQNLLEDIAMQKEGFGIKNVHKRIQLSFGTSYGVKIYSRLGVGTQVKITIPTID